MEREEELKQTIDELSCMLANAFKKTEKLKSSLEQAREEIILSTKHIDGADYCDDILVVELRDVLAILDKLITES